ncbi:polysaccharide deacetylase [Actinophytocola xinjiangensis]|uniref:Polysaccharide deacetylase n=1 Tax=Actinophytocola xinjiangensis TaxID=485602 RepID=A0A7Z0WRF1_9PSEU|nr:polysaccharide deacetylase [Actinophytocola xinjiangensis]OLF13968.1 polysaccharide deacetylase [Actinophytocola xinjiangensis]
MGQGTGSGRLRRFLGQGPLLTGVALALTLVVLVVVGTQRDDVDAERGATMSDNDKQSKSDGEVVEEDTAQPAWMHKLAPGEKPPQFVLFSFDGGGSHDHWKRVLPIAERTGAAFTVFLSGIYLLSDEQREQYTGPGHSPGRASIGFGGTPQDVRTLVDDLNKASALGIEVGTHYNGHFCQGSEPSANRWTADAWNDELNQFFRFVTNATGHGLKVDPATIKGGRTPCLEGDFDIVLPTLAKRGMTYDSSQVSDGVAWPVQKHGVWEFAMPEVKVPALGRKVIMMDYNLWYSFNGARNEPAQAAKFREDTLATYRAAHLAALHGNRAPLVVGNHFNEWSGGGFSDAVETFMSEVCTSKDTVCATYSQVIEWMALQDKKTMDDLRALPNAQVS